MTGATCGPWRACTDPQDLPQLLYSGLIAPIFYSPDNYVAVVSDTADVGDYAECCADAALMAAAPALREALRGLANNAPGTADGDLCWCSESWSMRGGYSHSPECHDARAALAASAPPPTAAAGAEDGGPA
jgi:hypothetical protein